MAEAPLSSCPFLVNLPEALAGTRTMEASDQPCPICELCPQDTGVSGPPWTDVAAVSHCVSRPGPGFCCLPALVHQVLAVPFTGEPRDLVSLLSPSPRPSPLVFTGGRGGLVL